MSDIIRVVCNKLTTVWAPTKKLFISWQFSVPYGVTKYSTGWSKNVVNQCLEFGYLSGCGWPRLGGLLGWLGLLGQYFVLVNLRYCGIQTTIQMCTLARTRAQSPPTEVPCSCKNCTHTHTHTHLNQSMSIDTMIDIPPNSSSPSSGQTWQKKKWAPASV